MQVFSDCTQSNSTFEPSFVEIHQVLKEIWLFENEFQDRKGMLQQGLKKLNNFSNFKSVVSKLSRISL